MPRVRRWSARAARLQSIPPARSHSRMRRGFKARSGGLECGTDILTLSNMLSGGTHFIRLVVIGASASVSGFHASGALE